MHDVTTLQDAEDALQFLDCADRDVWVRAAMQIKNEFGEEGFGPWNNWSQGYSKYKHSEAMAVWKSAKPSGGRGTLTIASLFHAAQQNGYKRRSYSEQDRKRFAEECEARRERVAAEHAADEQWCRAMYDQVANACRDLVYNHCKAVGRSKYLGQKKIGPCGALFPKHGVIVVTDVVKAQCYLVHGKENITAFFQDRDPDLHIRYVKPGTVVLPLRNDADQVRNVQVIFEDGGKKFIKCGQKSGLYFVIPGTGSRMLLCEGFATGGSLHAATGNPVFVTFDAGNLVNCAADIRNAVGQGMPLFICGDDDIKTEGNPGRTKATAAAQAAQAAAIFPAFSDAARELGLTDFNDLHARFGIDELKDQLQRAFDGESVEPLPPAPSQDETPPEGDEKTTEKDATIPVIERPTLEVALGRYAFVIDDTKLWDNRGRKFVKKQIVKDFLGAEVFKEWMDHQHRRNVSGEDVAPLAAAAKSKGVGGLQDALDRYVYLNPSQNAWDTVDKKVVAINDLRCAIAACFSDWIKHPMRREIRADNLVFDPTQQNMGEGHINRFKGLQMEPQRDDEKCRHIRHLVWRLCNQDNVAFSYLMKWLAYPLQNIGAKMTTAVLMHSDVHGSGKSLLFDGIMSRIYGEDYSSTFGQAELESQYNDWMSECLFGVFEEVLSRSQKYSHTGTVKQMISGNKFRVNQKFLSGWNESNHMNCVFLSNEVQPLPVEPSDRRFFVVWPEHKLQGELKEGVKREIDNGGIAAFYDYLLRLDISDYDPNEDPPVTEAKQRLIDFGRPTWEQFFLDWQSGELDLPYTNVMVRDLFVAFEKYCSQRREHCLGQNKFTGFIGSKLRTRKQIRYEYCRAAGKGTFFIVQEPPPDVPQKEFFGRCVIEWREAIEQMTDVSLAS